MKFAINIKRQNFDQLLLRRKLITDFDFIFFMPKNTKRIRLSFLKILKAPDGRSNFGHRLEIN